MFAALSSKIHVIVGPVEAAARYAQRRRWKSDEYEVVTDAQMLHRMDPPAIEDIVLLPAARTSLGKRVMQDIRYEIDDLKRLWHVRVDTALSS
jgi:hypothetical protein